VLNIIIIHQIPPIPWIQESKIQVQLDG